MDEQKIHLRKIRDFGENISDTFQFLRQQWKPLAKAFLLIAGAFLLAEGITNGIYQSNTFSKFKVDVDDPFAFYRNMFTPTYLLMILLGVLALVAMNTVVAAYLKLYEAGVDSPGVPEVWDVFKKYFFKCVLYYIPVTLLIGIGLLLCFAPGIYLAVVLTPFIFIVVTEDISFGDTFRRCFLIIKQNFWPSLGLYLIMAVIVAFSAGIIGLIVGGIVGLINYFTTKEIGSSLGIASSILNIFSYLFYMILFVSVGLQYYTLAEKTDGTGIAQRINSIGSSENPNSSIEEQF